MPYKKSHPLFPFLTFLIFFFVIILSSVPDLSLKIKDIAPFTPLPLLIAYSIFSDVKKSALAGFLTGACVDSIASGTYCFNTIALLIAAVLVCLSANNLFNKNIRGAVVLSLFTAVLYFFFRWLIFHAFGFSVQQSFGYLLSHSLPSAIYTAVFIIPFYFILKYFDKLKNQ